MGRRYPFNLRPALFCFAAFFAGIYLSAYGAPTMYFALIIAVLFGVYVAVFCRERFRCLVTAALVPAAYMFGIVWGGVAAGGFVIIGDSLSDLTVFSFVRERIKTVLSSSMGQAEAAFAKALLLGDTSDIDGGLLTNIRYGGVAHIFAVSGLHISEIYTVVQAVCRALKARREARDILSAVLVIYYVGVCGFSPSAMRAAIMCIALSLSFYFARKSDYLERVGIAGLITLAMNPLYIYKIGFILSFACCLGIGVYFRFFYALITRRLRVRALAGGIAMTLSVNIATFPIFLDYFSSASLWGLLLNLVFVPVISAVYAVLFITCALSLVMPFAAPVLLCAPAFALTLIIKFFTLADFTIISAGGFSLGIAKLPYYAAAVIASDKINLRLSVKLICAAFLLAAAIVCIILQGG